MLDGGRLGRIGAAGAEQAMAQAIRFAAPDFHLDAERVTMARQFTLEKSGRHYAGLFAAVADRWRTERDYMPIRSIKP